MPLSHRSQSSDLAAASLATSGEKLSKELKVEMSVTDTGIGIPEDDFSSLFKLFGKTSSNHNRNKTGTGLGLTICQRLCEKLGGKIDLKSKEGIGTKVTCQFV